MTRRSLLFDVVGIPGAQGSKRHVGRGVMVESSAKVKPWRSDVKAAAEAEILRSGAPWPPLDVPVEVMIDFRFHRPKSHYGTGRNANAIKATAPDYPTSRALGDADKLARSTLDALTAAGVFVDDSLVVRLEVEKVWAPPFVAQGALVSVRTMPGAGQ